MLSKRPAWQRVLAGCHCHGLAGTPMMGDGSRLVVSCCAVTAFLQAEGALQGTAWRQGQRC